MRTAEYFAKSSEDSAGVMQVWTEQMHEKTMSMHVITVFTLIFLPGTFVAVSLIMCLQGLELIGARLSLAAVSSRLGMTVVAGLGPTWEIGKFDWLG